MQQEGEEHRRDQQQAAGAEECGGHARGERFSGTVRELLAPVAESGAEAECGC